MKEAICSCDCMKKLIEMGKVLPYCPPYNYLADGFIEEEGTLGIVNQIAEDNGHYDDYTWISNINIYSELYPINYCPICGKKIEYKHFNQLTKKL